MTHTLKKTLLDAIYGKERYKAILKGLKEMCFQNDKSRDKHSVVKDVIATYVAITTGRVTRKSIKTLTLRHLASLLV